jgi:hypothetical protein
MRKTSALALASLALLCGCTENARTRSFGGISQIELEKCQRLVNVTWKESDLWILTKIDCETEPREYAFKGHSSWGIFEGTVVVKEQ